MLPGFYWRLRAGNGRIVAVGGERFASARNARRSIAGAVEACEHAALGELRIVAVEADA